MTTTLSALGQVDIPLEWRERDDVLPGQVLEIVRLGSGAYRIEKQAGHALKPKRDLLDVLLACPVKGFFEPSARGETLADLDPPFEA